MAAYKQREATGACPSNPPAPYSPTSTSVMTPPVQMVGGSFSETTYWRTAPYMGFTRRGVYLPVSVPPPVATKSVLEAYLLGVPFGLLGAHHFYLGRYGFSLVYFFTFGLMGIGWLVDLLRMPCLVSSVNKVNREKVEQLRRLQMEASQQQQQQQQQLQPGQVVQNVMFVPTAQPKSLADAYTLWCPFGLLGFHHFYLRNPGMGILYLFTGGLLGIGWLVDLFRMPSLVRAANTPRTPDQNPFSQCSAHLMVLSPVGPLGAHHYYLDRPAWGLLYTFTLGLMGVGWLCDLFRTSCLVKRANAIKRGLLHRDTKYLDDAYILCIPLGFLGLHHLYLRRYGWGALYFFTLGIMGLGWLIDWFRLPCLVRDFNAGILARDSLLPTTTSPSLPTIPGTTGGGGYGTAGLPNPVYPSSSAGYGYPGGYPPGARYPYAAGPSPSYPGQNTGAAQAGMYPPQFGVAGPQAGQAVDLPPSYEASMVATASTTEN